MPLQIYNNAMAESEVIMTSPRTGRPPKEVTKSVSLQLRITPATADTLKKCSDMLGVSRTEVIEKGIDLVAKGLEEKQK